MSTISSYVASQADEAEAQQNQDGKFTQLSFANFERGDKRYWFQFIVRMVMCLKKVFTDLTTYCDSDKV